MRVLFALLLAVLAAHCASENKDAFYAGRSARALVIIGVAEASSDRDPAYSLLWRRLDADGAFTPYDDSRAIDARTNVGGSVRVRGIPGEFTIAEVEPGAYALDSVFAVLREDHLNYIAQGVIEGPERPSFEVAAGEAVYLGIWRMGIEGANAVAEPWRLEGPDLRAVLRAARRDVGDVAGRQTHMRAVACEPHRMSNLTQRQIC